MDDGNLGPHIFYYRMMCQTLIHPVYSSSKKG